MPTKLQTQPGMSHAEVDRRYRNIRAAMQAENVDAVIVCGSEYTGFEGAVRYVSNFEIVHRFVYVLIPLEGEPVLVFPREARWIGDKSKPWVHEKVWADVPGLWLREQAEAKQWKRVGVYGLNYVMTVRDYRALAGGSYELVPFDVPFDAARAVKSEEELAAVRDSMDIIIDGFWALIKAYEPGKTEAEIMAPAVERFFARGAGLRMMNIVLSGTNGEAEAHFKVPGHRVVAADDLLLYSLEITGAEGYWVEFSRPLIRGKVSSRTAAMAAVYPEALEAARQKMRDGELASAVHQAAAAVFKRSGFGLGHLTGHSIGTTMIEYPAIGGESRAELRENMIFSFHPQVVDADGTVCLYTQDTYRIGKKEGERLADIPWKFFNGSERPR
ncbi:MAG TPA: M24 family metallopeptidase [Candidatus Sulfotelmatobacter sp.]|nr:M24 family metallopeptidase [Candidatus Sulfotelmatobacter sp.]